MRRILEVVLVFCVIGVAEASAVSAKPAHTNNGACQEGVLPSGALSLICIPVDNWNGDLVVLAQGYTAFNRPLAIQNLILSDDTYLPDLVQAAGFAFATTSYRRNGLVVLEGADDIRELVAAFRNVAGSPPGHTYLVGASLGGLVTTLLIEQSPELFSGGLAGCGPIADLKTQIDYWGDFRVLFDYFFPGVIPGPPDNIPLEVIDNWDTTYLTAIVNALRANPDAARQLIRTSKASINPAEPETLVETALHLLWYNVFATNDGINRLGGNPYSNYGRWYGGSDNDLLLNLRVRRVRADRAALDALAAYRTSGRLTSPFITLHTTGDDVVPFGQVTLYSLKARTAGLGSLLQLPVFRYGHCNFSASEVLGSFYLLVFQVNWRQPRGFTSQFSAAGPRRSSATR